MHWQKSSDFAIRLSHFLFVLWMTKSTRKLSKWATTEKYQNNHANLDWLPVYCPSTVMFPSAWILVAIIWCQLLSLYSFPPSLVGVTATADPFLLTEESDLEHYVGKI